MDNEEKDELFNDLSFSFQFSFTLLANTVKKRKAILLQNKLLAY